MNEPWGGVYEGHKGVCMEGIRGVYEGDMSVFLWRPTVEEGLWKRLAGPIMFLDKAFSLFSRTNFLKVIFGHTLTNE